MKDQDNSLSGSMQRNAAIFEESVNLPHDTAVSVAEDLQAPGMRKPSSDAVDRERNARAQAEVRRENER